MNDVPRIEVDKRYIGGELINPVLPRPQHLLLPLPNKDPRAPVAE